MELPLVPAPQPRCIHLQSKAMAVHGEEFENDPDYEAGLTDFICVKTGRALGPDNDTVNTSLCSNADRDCYEEY
ncbi:MAG: hypothetical protein L0241_19550 [Planctomycetia bacterium]|nr:hypothetical protein [Planctomycetia bacterium]